MCVCVAFYLLIETKHFHDDRNNRNLVDVRTVSVTDVKVRVGFRSRSNITLLLYYTNQWNIPYMCVFF